MIICVENLKESTTKLELIRLFSQVQNTRSTHKTSITFLFPSNAQGNPNFKVPFIIAPQNEMLRYKSNKTFIKSGGNYKMLIK